MADAGGVPPWLGLAAGVAATVLVVLATGDVLVLALTLAAVTGTRAAVGPVLVCLSIGVRVGTVSLAAAAGAQSVLGPAGLTGPPLQATAAWVSCIALIVAAPSGPAAIPLGLTAGLVVAGPAVASLGDLVIRSGAAVTGVAVAVVAARRLARHLRSGAWSWAPAGAGSLAFLLAVAA